MFAAVTHRFLPKKTDRYTTLGAFGFGLVFLAIFVLITGIALTYKNYSEAGMAGLIISIVLFVVSIFVILLSIKRIKL